jgi:hypothetical protein
LLGHTTIESTVRYRGIEVDDAPAIAENTGKADMLCPTYTAGLCQSGGCEQSPQGNRLI